MNLLVCTQKIDLNDSILGFFHRWVEELSLDCKQVTVICLEKGEFNLPSNVKVLSLGKENGVSKVRYIINFYKYIWKERRNYDSVLVHMNQIYIILGSLLWRLWNKKIGLWYAHGQVSISLRLAEKLTQIIFSSTASGFNLKSKKLNIVGQGIDIDFFKPLSEKKQKDQILHLITVGRISPVKRLEIILETVKILKDKTNLKLLIIGGPGSNKDLEYVGFLQSVVKDFKIEQMVEFLGSKTQVEFLPYLQQADLFVSASDTGSLDKVILEALACGVPVALRNENLVSAEVSYIYSEPKMLVGLIPEIINNNCADKFRNYVVENHSLGKLIKKIISIYERKSI